MNESQTVLMINRMHSLVELSLPYLRDSRVVSWRGEYLNVSDFIDILLEETGYMVEQINE